MKRRLRALLEQKIGRNWSINLQYGSLWAGFVNLNRFPMAVLLNGNSLNLTYTLYSKKSAEKEKEIMINYI